MTTTRRDFLKSSSLIVSGILVAPGLLQAAPDERRFVSAWIDQSHLPPSRIIARPVFGSAAKFRVYVTDEAAGLTRVFKPEEIERLEVWSDLHDSGLGLGRVCGEQHIELNGEDISHCAVQIRFAEVPDAAV